MLLRLRRHRARLDRGTALLESALVSPLFFFAVLAVIEYSLLFKDYISVNNSTRDAAREASATADETFADYAILRTASRSLSILEGRVNRVIVFKATGRNDAVPAACLAITPSASPAGVTGVCNVYNGSGLSAARAAFGYDATFHPDATLLDQYWPASTRANQSSTVQYIGVYVEAVHHPVTGLLSSDRTVTEKVIMPFETRRAG
ncbi:MAG: TadE/TadG family type IV pilus assembly protein [Acidimicrobiia bacterium]